MKYMWEAIAVLAVLCGFIVALVVIVLGTTIIMRALRLALYGRSSV